MRESQTQEKMTPQDQLIRLILIGISMLMSIAIIGLIGSVKAYHRENKFLKNEIKKLKTSSLKTIIKNEKKSFKR